MIHIILISSDIRKMLRVGKTLLKRCANVERFMNLIFYKTT